MEKESRESRSRYENVKLLKEAMVGAVGEGLPEAITGKILTILQDECREYADEKASKIAWDATETDGDQLKFYEIYDGEYKKAIEEYREKIWSTRKDELVEDWKKGKKLAWKHKEKEEE